MTITRDTWPKNFPMADDGKVQSGIPVWSLPVEVDGFTGRIEGRTTGSRRPCAAPSCGGWFIGVKWETGQQMYPCSRGWTYESESGEVHLTKGSGLSTTVAVDRTSTRAAAPPKSEWPNRADLGPSWRKV